jgi:hypothetical protein
MATEYVGNLTPAPGFKQGNVANDDELLYSMQGYTQKGVTLKAGQGVLPLGTVLARETASKRFVKFVSGGSGGAEVAVGILRNSVDTGSLTLAQGGTEFVANIVIRGILKLTPVSSANGGTSAIITAIPGSRADAVLGTFTF